MLITDRFVMINFPKTGSSFAREVIRKVHRHPGSRLQRIAYRLGKARPSCEELLMRQVHFNPDYTANDRVGAHGAYCQIPEQHRNKAIMSVMREPASRFVSLYEFRGWTRIIRPSLEEIKAELPNFPDLDFAEFFHLYFHITHGKALPPGMRTEIGPLTLQFIRFFARDPLTTMLALHDGTDLRADWDLHFPRVRFLHTETLNDELRAYMRSMGWPASALEFIGHKEKVNVTTRSRTNYLTDAMLDEIAWRERFFYQIFPEYLPALEGWRTTNKTIHQS